MIMNKTKNMIITNYTMRIIVIYFRKPIFLILISKSTYIDINNSILRECFKKKKKAQCWVLVTIPQIVVWEYIGEPAPTIQAFLGVIFFFFWLSIII